MNPFHFLKKLTRHPLVTGTIILTMTGLVSRLIGFFYRIYLSRLFGEENMGIYQLIGPVVALSFSLCGAAYQTAISKLTAELAVTSPSLYHPRTRRPFWAALSLSLPLSFFCTAITFFLAEPIGIHLLKEPRTIPLLQIISFSFPFVGIHACINGWFYGMKKAGLPALAQIIEQLSRVGCVYLVTCRDLALGRTPDISIAVFGLALGELISMGIGIVSYLPFFRSTSPYDRTIPSQSPATPLSRLSPTAFVSSYSGIYRSILSMVIPLTANRLVLNLLGSAESVAIPEMLRLYGYPTETALSVYGVLTGMAMPLIFFPNALTGSIAVMLLPMISENTCIRKYDTVRVLTLRTLKYSFLMGFACLLVFVCLGTWLGEFLFDSALAGQCIRTLGFICPFLYLDTTLSSILQGLGKAGVIFSINVLSLLVRLFFVYFMIPIHGIKGYLWGMLVAQLLLCILYLMCLSHFLKKHPAG